MTLSEKLKSVEKYCEEYGMLVNKDKTKFVVIMETDEDRQPIQLN